MTPDTPALNLAQLLRDADAVRLAQQGLRPHFAANCDAHTRETYATLLAALLLLEGEVSATEIRLFQMLLGALKLGEDSHAKLFAQAQKIDQTTLTEFCRLAELNQLASSFMLDALILCRLDRPLSTAQSQVLSQWASLLGLLVADLPLLGKLAAEVLGLPNATPWALDVDYSRFCVWGEWLEMPLTVAALKAGIRGGRWVLSQNLEVDFPWTMENAKVRFANQAILRTECMAGLVDIRHTQLVLPRLDFQGKMSLAVTGVQVSGKWPEAAKHGAAFTVFDLAQCTVADSTFNTPNRRAVTIYDTPAQLKGCRFVDCGSAETNGGGIYASNEGQWLHITASEFLGCAGSTGGGIYVNGDATLTACQFIDCTSKGSEGRSAAGYFNHALVDTLKQCQFVRSNVRGGSIGKRDDITKRITFCTGSTFTVCSLYHGDVHSDSVVSHDNQFTGGGVKERF